MGDRSATEVVEFGDFQTPIVLARDCCRVAANELPLDGAIVMEPTCGQGSFLLAAAEQLRPAQLVGYEIHRPYIKTAQQLVASAGFQNVALHREDFFAVDWHAQRRRHSDGILFLGNPPWVTNSALGGIDSNNVPQKSNADGLTGIEAITGHSNFDICESMLRELIRTMRPDQDSLAMLVKTSTARKVIQFAWKQGFRFSHASIHRIDTKKHFGVNVDACLLLLRPTTDERYTSQVCMQSVTLGEPANEIGFGCLDGRLVADPEAAKATKHLEQIGATNWRSGVKHDLTSVLELTQRGGSLQTRRGTPVNIERDRVFPLAKGADVANGRTDCCRRLLLPQIKVGESTAPLSARLPKTIAYLQSHAKSFSRRRSSIYRARDPFAIFGVGPYTFTPWKVAICGLYKRLTFTVYGPLDGKPFVFDDTTYLLPCDTQQQAVLTKQLLESGAATRFFSARIFWDAKRPITAQLLRNLDLAAVAKEMRMVSPAADDLR